MFEDVAGKPGLIATEVGSTLSLVLEAGAMPRYHSFLLISYSSHFYCLLVARILCLYLKIYL